MDNIKPELGQERLHNPTRALIRSPGVESVSQAEQVLELIRNVESTGPGARKIVEEPHMWLINRGNTSKKWSAGRNDSYK